MIVANRTALGQVLRAARLVISALIVSLVETASAAEPYLSSDRVPASPLIACDPYFSVWSPAKALTDADTTHWTGKPHRLTGLAVIDGKAYRLMGREPNRTAALPQVGSEITPTRTIYRFQGDGVEAVLEFATPSIPYDIDQLSRPVTYVSATFRATDGRTHIVRFYWEASGELAVNVPEQAVCAKRKSHSGFTSLNIGSVDQPVLETSGDDLRIDWGYLYVAAVEQPSTTYGLGRPSELQGLFASGEPLSAPEEATSPRADELAAAVAFDVGSVADAPAVAWLVVAYDDLESIEFMERPLKPYWRRNGLDAAGLLAEAIRDREKLLAECKSFDEELLADVVAAGGPDYAAIVSACYRQCFAAGKFVADANGQPLQFCKENHSNGCVGTSDVFYPMAPQFFLFGSSLAKSFVVPFMEYAKSDRWKFAFAPHDLGTYPKANGQVYGGGERTEENQMPVEESGNLLILMAVIAKIDGNAQFAEAYWPQLTQWAQYLRQEGFDPANQLCTDDFAGHMAHNVNLSAKAICGLGAYAKLCKMRGDEKAALEYQSVAREFAQRWIAESRDGDHSRLAFDQPGSWSQKYNLTWDRVLDLGLFDDEVLAREMAYYRRIQNRFGLPLDNRKSYSKLDWILWTACLTHKREDFESLVHPVAKFMQETPDRGPLTDWYETESGKKVGFTARPVVGGVFMRMLYDEAVWKKWAGRDLTKAAGYAPLPSPPKTSMRVSAADATPATWRYTTRRPSEDWRSSDFDDLAWQTGQSGFGTPETPGARVGTRWNTSEIWLRRKFDLAGPFDGKLRLHLHHDEDVEIYVNGVLAKRCGGFTGRYEDVRLRSEALASLKPTDNTFAVYCRQTGGGQYIDVGLVSIEGD
jgi:hypothetical protein